MHLFTDSLTDQQENPSSLLDIEPSLDMLNDTKKTNDVEGTNSQIPASSNVMIAPPHVTTIITAAREELPPISENHEFHVEETIDIPNRYKDQRLLKENISNPAIDEIAAMWHRIEQDMLHTKLSPANIPLDEGWSWVSE